MSGRGGLPIKNILYAVVALFLVYMLYVYHGSRNRLYEAEMTGARYKREVEERVSEIQDLVKGHDKFQETCQKEKRELQNTITSVNTKYKMLESHQHDTEADLNTMKQHMETMKQEHSDAYTQHAQEFQALKQEKENEIARIKDELADATRRNQELANNINDLKQRLQEGESGRNQLLQENARLQQTLAARQMREKGENVGIPQDPVRGDSRLPGSNLWLPNDDLRHKAPAGNVYDMKIDSPMKDMNMDSKVYGKADMGFKPEAELKPQADFPGNAAKPQDSDLGQVLAPKLNPDGDEEDVISLDKRSKDTINEHKPVVNPNDEQKAQILEPFVPNKDKDDEMNNEGDDRGDGILGDQGNGGEEGLGKRNARDEEEEREEGAKREEEGEGGDGLAPHQNPLALRQLEMPGHLDSRRREVEADEEEMRDRGGPGAGAGVGQQLPPMLDNNRVGEAVKLGDQYKLRRAINPVAPA